MKASFGFLASDVGANDGERLLVVADVVVTGCPEATPTEVKTQLWNLAQDVASSSAFDLADDLAYGE